jgi:RNA polymerase sigma factor (sigma-70 family)
MGMSEEFNDNESSARELLGQLLSSKAESTWVRFLAAYSPTIMMVASRYEQDRDLVNDCFLTVCEKLCENNCHRLLQFDPARGAKFRTWLIVIVTNLCIDWHRSNYGRPRAPVAVQNLPESEQLVYRYKFEQNLDLDACFREVQIVFPQFQREQLSESVASIHALLTPRQRWGLSLQRGRVRFGEGSTHGEGLKLSEIPEPGPQPDMKAQKAQERDDLLQAMSRLTPQQRLLLRLRFEEDLPLKVVARIAGLTDLHKARNEIQAALVELESLLARP